MPDTAIFFARYGAYDDATARCRCRAAVFRCVMRAARVFFCALRHRHGAIFTLLMPIHATAFDAIILRLRRRRCRLRFLLRCHAYAAITLSMIHAAC